MINTIWLLLKEPYPFNYELKKLLWLLPTIFVAGTLFLFIFQPFNNNWEEHKFPFIVICLIHSLTAMLCLLPFFFLADVLEHDKSKWTVFKEFGLMLFAFLTVGLGNYLIRDLIYTNTYDNWNPQYLIEEIKHAFAIGLIIYPIFILLNHLRLKFKHKTEGQVLSQEIKKNHQEASKEIIISNAGGNPELRLLEHQLLFIKAEGNYINVFYTAEEIEKKMIRNTISSVAQHYPDLFQPHRSYLVNLNNISHIGGNSQGYTLHFEGCDISIPVSRNKKVALIERQS